MLAIALVCVLRTMPVGFDAFLNRSRTTRASRSTTPPGIVYGMPYAYLARVRSVPGVVDAVSWTWFGGAVDRDKGVTFPNFAVDADRIGERLSRTSTIDAGGARALPQRTATARWSGA